MPWALRSRSRGRSPSRCSMKSPQAGPTSAARARHQVGGWQVGGEGAPLAGAGAPVRGDEDVVLIQLDLVLGGPDPEPLADEAMGPRVGGAGEDDMAVGVQLGARFHSVSSQGVTGSRCKAACSTWSKTSR